MRVLGRHLRRRRVVEHGADYKNAITNELFLQLNAALHNRIARRHGLPRPGAGEWNWFRAAA